MYLDIITNHDFLMALNILEYSQLGFIPTVMFDFHVSGLFCISLRIQPLWTLSQFNLLSSHCCFYSPSMMYCMVTLLVLFLWPPLHLSFVGLNNSHPSAFVSWRSNINFELTALMTNRAVTGRAKIIFLRYYILIANKWKNTVFLHSSTPNPPNDSIFNHCA